jgi:hypothetical protein
MCQCQRFPVLSHQLSSSSSYSATINLPHGLDHLCLPCIREFCLYGAKSVLSSYWTRELEATFSAYYEGFYTDSELDGIANTYVTPGEYERRLEQTMIKLEPLLIKHGYTRRSKNRQRKSLGSLD